jgi:hypothetical protein
MKILVFLEQSFKSVLLKELFNSVVPIWLISEIVEETRKNKVIYPIDPQAVEILPL